MSKVMAPNTAPIKQYRIILFVLLMEILVYFFCNIHIAAFQNNTFIGFEQDPLLWVIYFTGLPQYIIGNMFLSYIIDASILLLLLALIVKPLKNLLALTLLLLLFIFYFIFTAHLAHRNYQIGYLFVLFPFLFYKNKNKEIVFEFTRYFLLFFYISAAFFKITSGALFNSTHFSHAIINQFTPYFLEHSFSIRTTYHLYLINHHNFAQFLFFSATLFEFVVIIGFFTKRYDRYLAAAILIFHLANWFIMDIAPIGQIAFICTLFFSHKFGWKKQS